jgi:hypothetical protein
MTKKLGTWVCFIIALVYSGFALGHTSSTAPLLPDTEWTELAPTSGNQFSAVMLLSDSPDEVLRSWQKPEASVPVRTADAIAPGAPIVAFIFFTGCRPDENGLCNASVDFTVLKPDGSIYERFTDRELWKGRPAPPVGMMRLSAEYVGVVIEPQDPLGKYEVRASVHDLNAGETLELSREFTAKPE